MKKVSVPLVLQMENVECGAACLAMILRYFGKMSVPLEELREDCDVSRDGVSAKGIKKAAIKNGLICKGYRVDENSIKAISLPAIIHWNMGHFVVLCGYSKNYFYINDPALGKYKVSKEEFSNSFTGVVLTFEKSEDFVAERGKNSYIGFSLGCIKPFILNIFFISFLITIVTGLSMLLPFFNSVYIDDIILNHNIDNFAILVGSMIITILVSFGTASLAEKLSYNVEKYININLSLGFMEKILRLPIVFFNQRTPGELVNRQIGSFEISKLVISYITPIFFQIVLIIIYTIEVFVFNIYIAIIGIIAIVLNFIVTVYVSEKMMSLSALERKNTGIYQSLIASSLDMIETIKSCSCEKSMFSRLCGTFALNLESREKSNKIKAYSNALFYFINLFTSGAVLIVGVYEILMGEFSVGTAVGTMGMVSAFLTPIGSFINSIGAIFNLKSIVERTDDTMKYKEENIFLGDNEKQTKYIDGSIKGEDVYFRYGSSGDYVLKDFNFNLEKGKTIAFAGGSGSGKSTAAKIIAGLYSENEGNIYYGLAKKSELKREYFYSKIAIVSQFPKLYEGTVFDNITMWDRDISYDEVVFACKKACIHNDIVMRKDAYYEKITENGKNFSGGQMQRLEIARAIVRKPEILILDEATSALDSETEKMVMENINNLGITLIIISHRLSAIRNCDEILVFDNGEIIERGNHKTLTDKKGLYYNLVSNIGE
ncbi:MAG: peptidase domain-containing ABC transporter [Lachnospirales bacterium]